MGSICCTDKEDDQRGKLLDVRQERSVPNLNSTLAEVPPVCNEDVLLQREADGMRHAKATWVSEPAAVETTPMASPAPVVESSLTQQDEKQQEQKEVESQQQQQQQQQQQLGQEAAVPVPAQDFPKDNKGKSLPGKGMQPPHLSETFLVVLTKPTLNAKLGVDLTHRGTHLRVNKLLPNSAVAEANREAIAMGKEELKEGDVIVAVNGVQGRDQEMLCVVRDSLRLEMNVYRVN